MVNADCKQSIGLIISFASHILAIMFFDAIAYDRCTMKFPKVGVKECESGLLRKSAP